jgi:hypothetical protein
MSEATLTTAEACALLELDQEQTSLLLAGPFAPDACGAVTLRQVLGCALIYALPMLSGHDAVRIALSASLEARADARRILAVGWRGNTPCGCWLSGNVEASELRRPLLALPADHLLSHFETRLAEHRAAAKRLN